MRISNDLYSNDIFSSHDFAKGYTGPVTRSIFPLKVPSQVLDAHDNLLTSRKVNHILCSKAITEENVNAGDIVQIYVKKQFEKRGKWSLSKVVLSYNKQ